MSDIRSFFGGKVPPKEDAKKAEAPRRGRGRKVLDDSDDDTSQPAKKTTPKKAAAKKREPTPEGETTTTSDYFGAKKGKKSKSNGAVPEVTITPKKTPSKTASSTSTPNARSSTRTRKTTSYKEGDDDDDNVMMLDEDEDVKDDVFTANYKKGGNDDYVPEDDMKEVEMAEADDDDDDDDDDGGADEREPNSTKRKKAAAAKGGRKRKSTAVEDEDETPKKKKRAPAKKKPAEEAPESKEVQAIFDSIPTVRPPTPPSKQDDSEGKKKWNPRDFKAHANSGPAPAAGSKEVPEGQPGCLSGLSFVFTGLLQSIGREEGQELVKKYGGRVVGAPSKKTSYVVLGSDAGPSKLTKIKEFGIKTIDEDSLFALVRQLPAGGGDGKAASAAQEKETKKEDDARKKAAEEEAAEKKQRDAQAKKHQGASSGPSAPAHVGGARANDKAPADGPDSRLWTVKYAPTQISQVCGNKVQVEKLQRWLKSWSKNQHAGFRLPGPDGTGIHRAIMIHGPPGIGKTTAAHLVAKLEGFDIVETNASDTRSKKLVENGLKGVLDTTSLLGYFATDGEKTAASKRNLVLIMDEVDGMSAGDRGGVGALAAVCKKSRIPMILICNDRRLPKMKPFDHVTYDMPFRRPTTDMIRSRIMTIAFREKMKMPKNVIDALIEGSRADIRQVVNMVSTAKVDQEVEGAQELDFDSSKDMSKAWEKHVVLKPWDMVSKILGGGLFGPASKTTLNQKAELYFNDHEFAPLMLQENYLGTTPPSVSTASGRERSMKHLELASQAADSISDGDLVDRVIHGSEQHWSLMPVHAIFSFVRPASFVAGTQAGHQTAFTQWLGKNSSQGKMVRQVKEIQGHMRLKTSGDRHEIRQQYMPVLWNKLVKRLALDGKEAVPEVIELLDSYYLTKDDFDSILELGVGPMDQSKVSVESQTKATFTRLYNAASHPMPFMKASSVLDTKKAPKVKPDIEEALEESDEGEVVDEVKEEKADADDNDLSKDKYVKAPKKAAKGKGKKKSDVGPAGDEDEDEKPKKGKAPAKGRGRGGKK